jgi:hypothetical protein
VPEQQIPRCARTDIEYVTLSEAKGLLFYRQATAEALPNSM